MCTHVDKFSSFLLALECSLENSLRRTYECDDCSVGSLTRIHVENFNAFLTSFGVHFSIGDSLHYLVDNFFVAAFTIVRHAFYDLMHIQ